MRKKAVREDDEESEGTKFFACYLLTSLSPRHKGHTYIGFTVNPRRRIRQHNGELMCGAWRTKNKRPWEMVLCIYGFPTNVSALQFEWAWQHPKESLAVRKAASAFKSFSGVANKIKLAYTMLNLPSWQSLNLRVNYFSTKYSKHSAGCPGLPEHMKIQICPMDELPCYVEGPGGLIENEDWEDSLEVDEDGNASRLHEQQLTDLTIHNQQADELSEHLPITWEDCGLQFGITESPAQTSPSVNSRSLCTQEGPSIEGISSESGQLLEEKSYTAPTTDKNEEISRVGASQEIEVIELLTPSPSCTISATAKRRRVATLYPEIIDLTKSPIFV